MPLNLFIPKTEVKSVLRCNSIYSQTDPLDHSIDGPQRPCVKLTPQTLAERIEASQSKGRNKEYVQFPSLLRDRRTLTSRRWLMWSSRLVLMLVCGKLVFDRPTDRDYLITSVTKSGQLEGRLHWSAAVELQMIFPCDAIFFQNRKEVDPVIECK